MNGRRASMIHHGAMTGELRISPALTRKMYKYSKTDTSRNNADADTEYYLCKAADAIYYGDTREAQKYVDRAEYYSLVSDKKAPRKTDGRFTKPLVSDYVKPRERRAPVPRSMPSRRDRDSGNGPIGRQPARARPVPAGGYNLTPEEEEGYRDAMAYADDMRHEELVKSIMSEYTTKQIAEKLKRYSGGDMGENSAVRINKKYGAEKLAEYLEYSNGLAEDPSMRRGWLEHRSGGRRR